MIIFLTVFATIFIAEMGDKTQLLLVAMAGKYKISHILTGTWLATVVLNLLAVAVGAALGSYLDMRLIKLAAGLAFFWFAYSTLEESDEEEGGKEFRSGFGPAAAIFLSFFLGELGDKTQLSGITLAATYAGGNIRNACYVFLGCTLGLILADLIGLLAGLFLKSKMPTGLLNNLSFVIFTFFGVASIREAFGMIFSNSALAGFLCVTVAVIFVGICGLRYFRGRKT
ncbi:MAG: TMEM165/GDT1 family protein [Lachnospiraceae bacterium]|nr:TMEM165/GDT1 family protein [Lachnospiraceae bacterium]